MSSALISTESVAFGSRQELLELFVGKARFLDEILSTFDRC
jgi:hypothetical protein